MEFEAEKVKADVAAQSETLRDAAPVIEGIKVTSPRVHSEISGFGLKSQRGGLRSPSEATP